MGRKVLYYLNKLEEMDFLLMIINNNVPRKASSKGKRVQEITVLLSEIISAIFSKCLYNIEKKSKNRPIKLRAT